MMIVVPMLIETLTFGAIYEAFLGSDPGNAIMFAGVLLFLAAIAMLWIKTPRDEEEEQPPPERAAPAIGP